MIYVLGAILVALAAWLLWIPWQEVRHAERTGAHRLPFSRMLLRLIVAGCILMIGLQFLLYPRYETIMSPLTEMLYFSLAIFWAMVMFAAGFTDYLFVRRDYLIGRRQLLRKMMKSNETFKNEAFKKDDH